MGLADYLGWDFRSAGNLPIVNVPGCPVQPENFMETLVWLLYQAAGLAPTIPLDDQLRPQWIFGKTAHEGCDRAGYYEQGDFAHDYNSPKCQVKIGCWGPVVNCNVPKRGWMASVVWLRGMTSIATASSLTVAVVLNLAPVRYDEPPRRSADSRLKPRDAAPTLSVKWLRHEGARTGRDLRPPAVVEARCRRIRTGRAVDVDVDVRVELVERPLQVRVIAEAWAHLREPVVVLDEVAVRRDVRHVRVSEGDARAHYKARGDDQHEELPHDLLLSAR